MFSIVIRVEVSLSWCFTVNINGHTSYHDGKYYETCSECLLSEDTTLLPDGKSKGRYLFLFSKAFLFVPSKDAVSGWASHFSHTFISWFSKARTGMLEPSEFETFKKQAECLKFPPKYHFVSTGEASTQFRVPSCVIYIVNRARFCQICVQMTGKLPHLLQTRQRMINLMFSRLRTKDHSENVPTPKRIQLNLRWMVLSSLCTNIKLYFMKTLPAVLSVFG